MFALLCKGHVVFRGTTQQVSCCSCFCLLWAPFFYRLLLEAPHFRRSATQIPEVAVHRYRGGAHGRHEPRQGAVENFCLWTPKTGVTPPMPWPLGSLQEASRSTSRAFGRRISFRILWWVPCWTESALSAGINSRDQLRHAQAGSLFLILEGRQKGIELSIMEMNRGLL